VQNYGQQHQQQQQQHQPQSGEQQLGEGDEFENISEGESDFSDEDFAESSPNVEGLSITSSFFSNQFSISSLFQRFYEVLDSFEQDDGDAERSQHR
jgi:hypothetical protein